MKVGNITYFDDNGNAIPKEEFDKKYNQFNNEVDTAYNEIADRLVNRINSIATSDLEKLWMLFDYLTSEDMKYNLQGKTQDGRLALDYGYKFANYKSWKISQETKYPALLNNSGVCITYSLAFEDLCKRLKIPCKILTGYTGMEHAWNIVLINNQVKQIDVAFAILYRKINNKKDYFAKNNFAGRTINEDISSITNELKEQSKNMRSHIRIVSINKKPGIRIISRTDNVDKKTPHK